MAATIDGSQGYRRVTSSLDAAGNVTNALASRAEMFLYATTANATMSINGMMHLIFFGSKWREVSKKF